MIRSRIAVEGEEVHVSSGIAMIEICLFVQVDYLHTIFLIVPFSSTSLMVTSKCLLFISSNQRGQLDRLFDASSSRVASVPHPISNHCCFIIPAFTVVIVGYVWFILYLHTSCLQRRTAFEESFHVPFAFPSITMVALLVR